MAVALSLCHAVQHNIIENLLIDCVFCLKFWLWEWFSTSQCQSGGCRWHAWSRTPNVTDFRQVMKISHGRQNLKKQETQLSLTNLRDAFIGQSRSPNIVPFHMLGIVSYCAIVTLIVFKTRPFYDIRLQKCRDLENRVRGPSRSLEMSPCDRAHMTFYWRSIVTMGLSRVVSEIFNVEKCRDLEIGVKGHSRSLKVVPVLKVVLVFFSNFVPKTHRFWVFNL